MGTAATSRTQTVLREPSRKILSARRRATARNRALARLAREFPERYAELYREERGVER